MFLTASNLVHYLTARGLVSADAVISGDFAVEEAGRRNRNFKVHGRAAGLFVKQPQRMSADAVSTVRREAQFYQLVASVSAFESLRPFVPPLVDYNPANSSLVVALLRDAETLHERHLREQAFSVSLAERLGAALGAYHAAGPRMLFEPVDLSIFPRQLPWIFVVDPASLRGGIGSFAGSGPVFSALLDAHPGLLDRIRGLSRAWRVDGLIHGDLKWDNLVVRDGPDDGPTIAFVDWELADLGEVAWDIASLWTAYLACWMFYPAVGPDDARDTSASGFRGRMRAMQPALSALWSAYVARARLDAAAAKSALERSIELCSARLAVLAFECVFNAPSSLDAPRRLLVLAEQIAVAPDAARTEIFGDMAR